MLDPRTVVIVNTAITSLPFAVSLYLVARRLGGTLVQLYSLFYLSPVLLLTYGIFIPVPGNLYAYLTGAPVLLTYGVVDAAILVYAVGSALAVVTAGVDQWADVLYSGALTAAWIVSEIRRPGPRESLALGSVITAASNVLVAAYRYQAWPIVPLPSVIPQFLAAVGAAVGLEAMTWWILLRMKRPAGG